MKSAKAAGTRHERVIADYLRDHVSEFIDRRVKTGAKDCGDIANLRTPGGSRIVVECKDTSRTALGTWQVEAEAERINDEAIASLVVHKRHGKGQPGDQWVTMTVADLAAILTDRRPQ